VYYVKVVTRSSGGSAKGTPRRAIDYITDRHGARRDPAHSQAELRYIARLGEGWKTDLEGGRVPLVGFGTLAGVEDAEELASRFEGPPRRGSSARFRRKSHTPPECAISPSAFSTSRSSGRSHVPPPRSMWAKAIHGKSERCPLRQAATNRNGLREQSRSADRVVQGWASRLLHRGSGRVWRPAFSRR